MEEMPGYVPQQARQILDAVHLTDQQREVLQPLLVAALDQAFRDGQEFEAIIDRLNEEEKACTPSPRQTSARKKAGR